jgi:hypothetical protein
MKTSALQKCWGLNQSNCEQMSRPRRAKVVAVSPDFKGDK